MKMVPSKAVNVGRIGLHINININLLFVSTTPIMAISEAVQEPLARKRERGRGEGFFSKG